ncbi:hypothetical protein [Flavobacterium sp. KJJ]|uniref:hypothetical protein n=1 Tax=Flavobacterium sp. KJJ TaxID=1270193 RepID=UPI000492FAFD|nr:hypothetical protein [Flavobacterium sp. KJJ]
MSKEVKSGQEILDSFFETIQSLKGVDPKISQLISQLYKDDLLSEKAIKNGLEQLRKKDEKQT